MLFMTNVLKLESHFTRHGCVAQASQMLCWIQRLLWFSIDLAHVLVGTCRSAASVCMDVWICTQTCMKTHAHLKGKFHAWTLLKCWKWSIFLLSAMWVLQFSSHMFPLSITLLRLQYFELLLSTFPRKTLTSPECFWIGWKVKTQRAMAC